MKAEFNVFCQSFSRLLALITLSSTTLFLCNCSGLRGDSNKLSTAIETHKQYMASGSITISRPVPVSAVIPAATMLGLLPGSVPALANSTAEALVPHTGSWMAISRKDNLVSVMNGNEAVYRFKGEGFSHLVPGSYSLLHKQRNPLWYAPDSYFTNRRIEVPPAGDKARFLRGALGNFVLFLNKDTPIHSGPVWADDIGGARLDENDLSRVYYKLEVGTSIEVK